MLEVKMELYTAEELKLWAEAGAAVLAHRQAETAARVTRRQEEDVAFREKLEKAFYAPVEIDKEAPAVISGFPELPPITDADLETAITAYWKKMGLPAAKEVLARFGVERVGAIPANRRGEAMLAMATG